MIHLWRQLNWQFLSRLMVVLLNQWYASINWLFQGFYRGGRFVFSFKVGPNYPHEPPKVKCETQVYHPNIDLDGNVCLNILREDWKPVLTINSIVYGLQYLFLVCFFPLIYLANCNILYICEVYLYYLYVILKLILHIYIQIQCKFISFF